MLCTRHPIVMIIFEKRPNFNIFTECMKGFLLVLLFIVWLPATAQKTERDIKRLTQKINASANGEKLKWLDSLSTYIKEETNFQNDSVAKEAFRYALKLDSNRIAAKNAAYLIYFQNNITKNLKEGNRLFLNYLEQAKKCGDHRTLAKYYLEGADNYFYLEDQKKAIEFYNLSEAEAELAKDTLLIGLAKLYKGHSLSLMGEFSEASKELQDAIRIFQKKNNTHYILSAKNLLAELYGQNSFYEEAQKEREEAIELAKSTGNFEHLSVFYSNSALAYQAQENYQESIKNYKLALSACRKTDNPRFYESTFLAGLVIAYSVADSIRQAEFYLKEFENIYKNGIENVRDLHLDALMQLAYAKKQYPRALEYGKAYLKAKSDGTNFQNILYAESFMSKVYEAMGNTEQAFAHFKKYAEIKDSIGRIRKVNALSYYQTLYETHKRDLKIKEQEGNIALLDAKNRRYNQMMLFGGLGLLVIFGFILLIRSRNAARRRQEMQAAFSRDLIRAQEDEKVRISRELHDSVGQKVMLLTRQAKVYDNRDMQTLATHTLDELRAISRGLHPATLDKLGLTAAILAMINEVDANTDIFFTNEIENIDRHFSKEASLHLYRILQEILNNMVKHADAETASVSIEVKKENIEVTVTDDGKGFEYPAKSKLGNSLGMRTLVERSKILNSILNIKSKPGSGTVINLLIPIQYV